MSLFEGYMIAVLPAIFLALVWFFYERYQSKKMFKQIMERTNIQRKKMTDVARLQ
tara:strand:- start:561 stop:725 length:165 start_codon:yes stop_codon:yes gene_type:complete